MGCISDYDVPLGRDWTADIVSLPTLMEPIGLSTYAPRLTQDLEYIASLITFDDVGCGHASEHSQP
jgi:hypothetical protein